MAYDQNSTYEPPPRHYYQPESQSNPGYSEYQDYASSPYDHHKQGYSQGYSQGYAQQNGNYDYGYEQNMNAVHESAYHNGPQTGYDRSQNGGGQYYEQGQDRNYDPRYQPRAPRGPPHQQHHAPHSGPRGHPPPQRAPYQEDPRGAPRQNGHPPQQAQRSRDAYPQNNGQYYTAPAHANGNGPGHGQAAPQHPEKQSMEEWKRQEKEKMKKAATSPETMPFDNAFPIFKQKENGGSGATSKASTQRGSAEQRPHTAGGRRPGASREDSYQAQYDQQARARRPDMERHQTAPQYPHAPQQHDQNHRQGTDPRPVPQREISNEAYPPVGEDYPEQWPMVSGQTPPKSSQDYQHPSQERPSRYAPDAREPHQQGHYRTERGAEPQRKPNHRQDPPQADAMHQPMSYANGPMSPADLTPRPSTAGGSRAPRPHGNAEQYHPPNFPQERPRRLPQEPATPWTQESQGSPEDVGDIYDDYGASPPRPQMQRAPATRDEEIEAEMPDFDSAAPGGTSLAHKRSQHQDGRSRGPAPQMSKPPVQRMGTAPPQMTNGYGQPPGQLPHSGSAPDLAYNQQGYGPRPGTAGPGPRGPPRRGMTDPRSAGSIPSSGHPPQRMGTAPPQMTNGYGQPPGQLPHSGSAPDLAYNQQGYGPRPGTAGPGPRGPPRRGMTDPRSAGSTPTSAYSPQRQYDIPYRNAPPSGPGYQQDGPLPPPQAPFATEPQVRRSLDDGRGPPYRQGPPHGQQLPRNGQPPRGPYPPQQRPDLDRNQTNQTVSSDPGQDRVGSAPPPQQGIRGPSGAAPYGAATGAPLTQHRSAPENEQARHSNPDNLPHHPVPVRPGHIAPGQGQPAGPPPVRNYTHNSRGSNDAPHQRQASADHFAQPVTGPELQRLRAAVDAPPHSPKQALLLVEKLVEASAVLAVSADPKQKAKDREMYINEAYKRLKKLVANGYPEAQFYLADCHGQGMMGLEVDTKEAFKLYQAAAKAGHAQAAYRTAVCCEMGPEEGGGTSRDYAKAVQWYRRAAALGDGPAMYKLGAILLKGLLGQQKNMHEAVTWLRRGAERADRDNPHALHELAGLHESSNTDPEVRNKIPADDKYARDLYMQAANLGYKFSQFRLGQAYEYGNLGLQIDNRSSIAWYTKAAAQGEHQAELALSGWYLTGADNILEHSDTEAFLWARKAATAENHPGVGKAMFAMGYFAEKGIGCPASIDEAKKWYGRAASYKFPKAVERLEELRKNPGKKKNSKESKLVRNNQKQNDENCAVM